MSITCQVCGTVNPDGTQFCEGCGVELKAQAAASTPAEVPAAAPVTPAPEVVSPELGAPTLPDAAATASAQSETPAPAADASAPAPELSADVSAATSASSAAQSLNPDLTSSGDAPKMEGNVEGSAAQTTPEQAQPVGDVVSADSTSTEPVSTDSASAAPAPSAEQTSAAPAESQSAPVSTEAAPAVAAAPATAPSTDAAAPRTGAAKLGIKKFGTATGEFIPLQGEKLLVGRFDASSGPVDVDLSALQGAEHISRHHAELYREGGQWFVRDLGSTNGVFVKKAGQSAFSPRLQEPTAVSDGDELAFGNLMLSFHQEA